MLPPRSLASLWSARAAALASRALGRGGGTAIAGVAGLALDASLVRRLAAQLGHSCALITGTNGKTTTSRLVAEMARAAGLGPLANASGSNLMRGLASTLALESGLDGSVMRAQERLGVFEVDEATVPLALPELRPRVVAFTNLFRDQLDRYGEVETVASLWREALATPEGRSARLVLNADDPLVARLGEGRDDVVFFGVDEAALDRGEPEHAADAPNCRCGAPLHYEAAYYGHEGIWSCPSCGRRRPAPQVRATSLDLRDGRSQAFCLHLPEGSFQVELAIGGLYSVYNALAAAATGIALGLPQVAVLRALQSTGAAFGRQEAFEVDGRRVEVFLGKNPAGLNQVLATLRLDPSRRSLLVVLNDNFADGRDISWVWDADFEDAAGLYDPVVVSGRRAWDMALRLKYASWPEASLQVEEDVAAALDLALARTPQGACLTVVPTYTAMLEVRELLAKRAGRRRFWEQS